MTTKRLTPRRNKLEKNKNAVLADILLGERSKDIAEKYGMSQQAVCAFERRYAATIVKARTEVENQVVDYAIAQKVSRIAAKDRRWQLLEAVRQARSHGGTGEETGLVAKTYKSMRVTTEVKLDEDGEPYTVDRYDVVTEYKVDNDLIRAMEATEHGAAEELGQLPKQGDTFVLNPTQNNQINFFDREQSLKLARTFLGMDDAT